MVHAGGGSSFPYTAPADADAISEEVYITTIVVVVAVASMLMMFRRVRQFGVSILTSAGIVGVVVGLAAQRSIANLLVGL